jgi:hypothetical protein
MKMMGKMIMAISASRERTVRRQIKKKEND